MFNRNCPKCEGIMSYSSKQTYMNALSKNGNCRSCAVKETYIKDPDKNRGNKNGMFGNNIKNAMLNKYGEDMAKEMYSKWKKNLHKFGSGEKNPQYGKSPFTNGGRSYHGWYEGTFFRSTFELIFLMENRELDLIPADNMEFRVEYRINDKKKFYYPDFYSRKLNTVYEIKPYRWINREENRIKIENASEHFNLLGIGFSVITEKDMIFFNNQIGSKNKTDFLTFSLICEKFLSGEITLTGPSINRLKNRLTKRKETLKLKKLEEMEKNL